MLKIAYILTPVDYGGSEKVNLTFLKNVDRERFDIRPILLVRPWEKDNFFQTKIQELHYSFHDIPVAVKKRSEGKDYFRIIRCIYALYKILSAEKFHIVHSHGYFADIIGIIVSRILKIPHIATCHGFISNDIILKIYNKIDKLSLRFCNRVIAVTDEIRKELIHNGIKESKVITIRNATDNISSTTDIFMVKTEKKRLLNVRENYFIIGYVGRLSKEKGIKYLINAGKILKERIKYFKILIIGSGPERENLETISLKLGLKENITFTGFLSDVEQWIQTLDVLVLPSLTEGTPLALLEAMSCAIPVVATNVGGVPEIIESGKNGILVEPRNAKELADAICMLQKDELLRLKLGKEAQVTVQNQYGVQNWIKRIEDEYLRIAMV